MDNQHKKIIGYRDLSEEEIALVNQCKHLSGHCGTLIDHVMEEEGTDKRSAALARTHMQTGFMWLIRSITKPETFG